MPTAHGPAAFVRVVARGVGLAQAVNSLLSRWCNDAISSTDLFSVANRGAAVENARYNPNRFLSIIILAAA